MPLALNHRLKKYAYPFSMDLQSVLNMLHPIFNR